MSDTDLHALADELLPVFYEDLKRIGRRERRRVGAGETLQTTALVNEAYLKLRSMKGWADDRHFLAAAALAMRHALVNHAKAEVAQKRGAVLHAQHYRLSPFVGGKKNRVAVRTDLPLDRAHRFHPTRPALRHRVVSG